MKTISIIIAILFLCGFVSAQTKPYLINTDEKFTLAGKILTKNDFDEPTKKEVGALNAVSYSFYYSDASGSFSGVQSGELNALNYKNNWSVGCKKDAIDDSKICYMSVGGLMVFVEGKDKYVVSVGSHHFPGTSVAVRIDENAAIKGGVDGDFSGTEASGIINQLKSGKKITTRYRKFPNEYNTDETIEIYGFKEAFQYINWAFSKIK